MPLSFIVLGSVALGIYALTYFVLRRRLSLVNELLSKLGEESPSSSGSVLLGWLFRGRGATEERLARLFSVFPPLMLVVTAAGMILAFLTAIAFLRVATSVGSLVAVVIFALPYYRAADAFDMFILVTVAQRAGLDRLSTEDINMLETARLTLSTGAGLFGRLSLFLFIGLGVLYAVEPFADSILVVQYPDLSSGLLVFVGVVATVLVATYTARKVIPSDLAPETGEPREIAMPMAGDHLSYGAVWTLEAARARLVRKFRLGEESDEEPKSDGIDSNHEPRRKLSKQN